MSALMIVQEWYFSSQGISSFSLSVGGISKCIVFRNGVSVQRSLVHAPGV